MIKFQFDKKYFKLTLVFFAIEVFIAVFIHDSIVRPFGGDALVVILLFCFLRTFLKINEIKLAHLVLLFTFIAESLQYLDFVKYLGLTQYHLISILLGRTFSWLDLIAYSVGYVAIILFLKKINILNMLGN